MRIVLFDSGFGLIPFYHALLKNKIYHTYFLEMGEELFPFGEKRKKELIAYAKRKLEEWKEKNMDHVYIICNTFSLILKTMDLSIYPYQIHCIVDETLKQIKKENVTLIGTKKTIECLKKEKCTKINGSSLVRYIEHREIKKIVMWIKRHKIETPYLVLGCTHFSHIAFLFSLYFPSLILFDPYINLLSSFPKGNQLKVYMDRKAKKVIESFEK